MRKLGLVITDGVGYRNFMYSEFYKEAAATFDEVVIYSGLPEYVYVHLLEKDSKVKLIELPVYTESHSSFFFRKLKEIGHMRSHQDYSGIKNNLNKSRPNSWGAKHLLIRLVFLITRFLNSERWIKRFESWQFIGASTNSTIQNYRQLLAQEQVDLLFFTHQRPAHLAPFAWVAQRLSIPTATFIFSWDNLASKGRMMYTFDYYLVWSELMKKELLHFYPGTSAGHIAVVGTPQFEPYVMKEYHMTKDEVYSELGLNPSKKTICYSCADAGIGQNDPLYIQAIYRYVSERDDLQLLVRTSPAEDGERFYHLKEQYPNIKWNIPDWFQARCNHLENWSQRIPQKKDLSLLCGILKYCEVNVNMLSTMSLDFMLFDKPVVNIAWGNNDNGLYNDQLFLSYHHLQPVIHGNAVYLSTDEKSLHESLDMALLRPEDRTHQRKELLNLQISKALLGTSERIAKTLYSWS